MPDKETKKQLKERIANLKVQLERATKFGNERATELNDERVQRKANENRITELEAEISHRNPYWDGLQEGI